jgi:hypothetical protein
MANKFTIPDIAQALAQKAFPTVTMWNRQEGRPRTDDFKRALRAEVRDALWMLSRQWQLGELQGDDAGTPVLAKAAVTATPMAAFQAADGPFTPMAGDLPLETRAERRPIPFGADSRPQHLDLRLQLGRQFTRLLVASHLPDYVPLYRAAYPFTLPDPTATGAELVHAHLEARQQYAAIAGRAMDGYTLYQYLSEGPPHAASDGIALLQPSDGTVLDQLGRELQEWFDGLYQQPGAQPDAWLPPRLEYQFAVRAGADQLEAPGYAQATPDWFVFDASAAPTAEAAPPPQVITLLPTAVEFDGMPDTRWWAFEDRKTNLGNVTPGPTELAKLLLLEFALVYANDWFVIPFRLPVNAVARVEGLMVTNTFGERTWIEPAGGRPADSWQRWEMFTPGGQAARPALVLPALTVKTQEGPPLEEVALVRDEMANMVWGVESIIPLVNGYGRAGRASALETQSFHQRQVAERGAVAPALAPSAPARYLAMTQVPEHWIPFLPVHVDGSNREIQLQRSKMLRLLDGDTSAPQAIPPRTALLREGLDQSPRRPYFVHEEEVPRAGIRVAQTFQRTRWTGGQVYLWLAASKQPGRGEAWSGLAFDQLVADARR